MGFLGLGKKPEVVDWSARYKKQKERIAEIKEEKVQETSSPSNIFSFFGNSSTQSAITSSSGNSYSETEDADDKKRKLARRLLDITNKLEDLSNQLYHLKQRMELIEKKVGINPF